MNALMTRLLELYEALLQLKPQKPLIIYTCIYI